MYQAVHLVSNKIKPLQSLKLQWLQRFFQLFLSYNPLFMSSVFRGQPGHSLPLCHYFLVGVFAVRDQTIAAVLYSLLRIPVVSSAAFAEGVQGAVAEQAVKLILVFRIMTWEILTFPVGKEFVIVLTCHCLRRLSLLYCYPRSFRPQTQSRQLLRLQALRTRFFQPPTPEPPPRPLPFWRFPPKV